MYCYKIELQNTVILSTTLSWTILLVIPFLWCIQNEDSLAERTDTEEMVLLISEEELRYSALPSVHLQLYDCRK